jgi:FlaA1/EpsC-like NDP-sugar epimerase
MISSDKAVNPSSVMGATKRITELIVSAISASGGRTNFVCVRFGNVLGSNGSVIPLFQAQIAAGGPVTVTHPDIRRYFMTAREAAQLVLQASAMGQRGDIFILDMGEPIKIVDLARNMIRLVGLEPDEEIGIRFTGLRPGEKLFEELSREDEQLQPTSHDKIQVCKGPVLELRTIEESISEMRESLERRDHVSVMSQIAFLVPEYQPGKDGVG